MNLWRTAATAMFAFALGVSVGILHIPERIFARLSAPTQSPQLEPNVRSIPHNQELFRANRQALFQSSVAAADMVMLGDSITEGAEWTELLPGLRVLNRGVRWDTSADLLLRLHEVQARKPRVVFLMIGINDAMNERPQNETVLNVREIVTRLKAGGTNVIIQSVLFVVDSTHEINSRVSKLNRQLALLASELHVRFLDVNAVVSEGNALLPQMTYDGIHLNAMGYQQWSRVLKSELRAENFAVGS